MSVRSKDGVQMELISSEGWIGSLTWVIMSGLTLFVLADF